jgi:hypothetical protein
MFGEKQASVSDVRRLKMTSTHFSNELFCTDPANLQSENNKHYSLALDELDQNHIRFRTGGFPRAAGSMRKLGHFMVCYIEIYQHLGIFKRNLSETRLEPELEAPCSEFTCSYYRDPCIDSH